MTYLDRMQAGEDVSTHKNAPVVVPMRVGRSLPAMTRPNRRVWLAKRRKGITATDAPALLGLSPWKTPLDVWLDKTGRADEVEVSYAMERGNALEPLLRAEYQRRTGLTLIDCPPLSRHPSDPLALASLDAAVEAEEGHRIVEIKTTGWRDREVWWDESLQVPDHYLAQVAWQQYVTGCEVADMIADVAGDVRIIAGITRSREFEAYAVPLMHRWWRDHVVADVAPPIDPVRDYEALSLLWEPIPGERVTASEEVVAWCREYAAAGADEAAAKQRKKEPRGRVREAMADASKLVDAEGRTWAWIDKRGALTIRPPKHEEREETDE